MRIGFVAEPYEESNASGMGYVVLELMKHLQREGREHEYVFYSSRPLNRELVPGTYTNVIVPRHFLAKLWWFYTMKRQVDALFVIAPLLPLILPRGIHTLLVCQELGSQKIQPKNVHHALVAYFRDHILMPLSVKRAAHIIAASRATKDDILKYYPAAAEKVTVVHDGYQDLSIYAGDAPSIDENLRPYFFFAGKLKYRKNIHGIVSGFIRFRERTNARVKLVLAGDYGGEYYETFMRELREHKLDGEVYFPGYTVGGKLYAFYTKALALVFPSLNEGFGMPILEAMSLGVPVITSKISSMGEVAGDAGLLVDPYDPDDIAKAMERIYRDETLRISLIERGREHAKTFSWQRAARECLSIVSALR